MPAPTRGGGPYGACPYARSPGALAGVKQLDITLPKRRHWPRYARGSARSSAHENPVSGIPCRSAVGSNSFVVSPHRQRRTSAPIGDATMARLLASDLAPLLRHDGEWLRCAQQGCDAYWGQFRSWTWLRAKVGDHAARKHAGRPQAAGNRPQRTAAAAGAQGAPAGLNVAALAAEFAKALGG